MEHYMYGESDLESLATRAGHVMINYLHEAGYLTEEQWEAFLLRDKKICGKDLLRC